MLVVIAASQRVLSRETMVDLDLVVVNALLIVALRKEIIVALIRIDDVYRGLRKTIK
jgi:hypothetical protein